MPWLFRAMLVFGLGLLPPITGSIERSPVRVHSEDWFYVAGFSARTNNARETSGQGVIGELWQDFYQKNLGAQIPHRIGKDIIVVYSDYSSDEKGDYTYLLGAPVSTVENLPSESLIERS